MTEEPSQEELDHTNFQSIFYPAFSALALSPKEACESMGSYNTAWEIQDELVSFSYLIRSRWLDIDAGLQDAMARLIESLRALPSEAIQPECADTRTHDGCVTAMSHPAWTPLRHEAASLIMQLAPALAHSKSFFEGE